jgi:glycosyltransferase involved in cell wall biosynthesis
MEAYLDHLSAALAAEGHAVRVVTRFVDKRPQPLSELFRSAEPARTFHRGDVEVHVVAPTPVRRMLLEPTYRLHHHTPTERVAIELYVRGFYTALRTALEGSDVVHFSGTGREMLGFAAARVAADLQVPFVVTPHVHAGSWGDGAFDFRLYKKADAVIALTEVERSVLVDGGLSAGRVHVQGHGVNVTGSGDGPAIREELGLGTAPMVFFLGRKSGYKGFPLLLASLPTVWEQHPDAQLVIAGPDDPSLDLPAESKRVLADPRVVDLGFVSDKQREDLYAACDVFCLPSKAEAFGLVYVEAGFYGKPVVALNIPTLRELIEVSGRGLLVAPSTASVAGALNRLLADPELRATLGHAGRRYAKQQSWQHVAQSMRSIYAGTTPQGVLT